MKHLKYLRYVLIHKWHVTRACLAHGLFWRGLVHDLSKFRPSEWFPYSNHFYGRKSQHKDGDHAPRGIHTGRDETGYYKPTDTGDPAFDFAWLLHQKRNDHHWQWWVLPEDDGGVKILPMSARARLEMVCDWCGASIAQGKGGWSGVQVWYEKNKGRMQLHEETRTWVESFLEQKP
jgi:hypothetical protein